MPTFKCTYRNQEGKLFTNIQTGRDRGMILDTLRKSKLYPITVEDVSSAYQKKGLTLFLSKENALTVFTQQLSELLSSGVDLTTALELLAEYTKHPLMQKSVIEIKDHVSNGGSLGEGLSKFPDIFPPLFISTVKAGEAGENLEMVLRHLANYTQRRKQTKDVVTSMLIYPTILLIVGAGTMIFIMTFVLPRMIQIFDDMQGQSLPLVTKIMIALSGIITNYGWLVIIIGFIAAGLIIQMLKNPKMRYKWDRWIYHMPVFGGFIQKVIFVRFSQILELVLANGVSLVQGLDIAQGVIHNSYCLKQLESVKAKVIDGNSLSNSLLQANIFSPLTVHMIAVGEETGELEKTLHRISQNYIKEVEQHSKKLINLIEPAIILILAIGVGFLVTAILLPIFQMDLSGL